MSAAQSINFSRHLEFEAWALSGTCKKINAVLSVSQHQAWNQTLQLSCNKRSSFVSHIANMLPSKENK